MGKIILVRHGETELNRKGVFFGRMDPSLNETGKGQLEKTAVVLEGFKYEHIHASPLARAKESAEIISRDKKKINFDRRLMELDFGIFEGLSYEEIETAYPEECKKNEENWEDYNFETGESVKELQHRAVEFIESLNKEQDHLVVTHWGVINTILSHYFSRGLEAYWKFDLKNGGIAVLEFSEGFPILRGLNIGGENG